jgi:Family of unknown function (DUF5519)
MQTVRRQGLANGVQTLQDLCRVVRRHNAPAAVHALEHTMGTHDHASRLEAALREWPRVDVAPHRFGGLEFRVDRREIGHVHPSGMLDIPFPMRMRRELVASGRAVAHQMLPNTGWVTFRIRSEHDLPAAIALLRLNYDRLVGTQIRAVVPPISPHVTLVRDRDETDHSI